MSVGRKGIGWLFKCLFVLALIGTFLGTVTAAGVFYVFSRDLPPIVSVEDYRPLVVSQVFAKDGDHEKLIGEFYKERRYLTPYEKIPPILVDAFISAEDDTFFSHQGINFASILRAAIANFRAGQVVQGGSTITQQVAKSLLLTPERSFSRKIKEVILANRLERNLTKEQILYLYLNQIYLGHGAYGVQAAARTYYHKDVGQLNLAEAAMLAGLPTAPGKFSPNINPKRAKERQLYVLRRMFENKYITEVAMQQAAAQPLEIYGDEDLNKDVGGHLVEYVRRYLVDKYGDKRVFEDGLTIHLPTPYSLIMSGRKSLREGLRTIDKRIGYRGPLKHIDDPAEMDQWLADERLDLIEKHFGYKYLLPDGRLDTLTVLKDAGLASEAQLLGPGELYQALVTGVDDKRKVASVMLGTIHAEIPMSQMRWAKPPRDEKNPGWRPPPRVPSQVLKKGDIVNVSLVQASDKGVTVALDQKPLVEGALLSFDAKTGELLAMEGGYDFRESQFNRAFQAQRQPGSAFKPIIYAAALTRGFTPASIIVDSPIVYGDDEKGKWKPSNYEEKFYGDTTFRQALIKSRNVPTIKIVQQIQVPFVIDFARRLGLNAQFSEDLSISLGSAAVSLFDMVRAYALFPRLGKRLDPVFITQITDRDGNVILDHGEMPVSMPSPSPTPSPSPSILPEPDRSEATVTQADGRPAIVFPHYPNPKDPDRLMDPRVAFVMTHLMKEVVNYGTGYEARSLGRPAAGKTGTTNDSVDAWFMGFTPNIVTGVWVGFDNSKSIGPGETGARAALPIWLNYMSDAVKNYPDEDFTIPPGVVFANINPSTGKLVSPGASDAIREAFIAGTEPLENDAKGASSAASKSEFLKEDIE